jgi:curved DNA-binding protein CbpA
MCLIKHMTIYQDHYAVLGLAPTAAPDVIRAAYRVLAQRHHPDRQTSKDESTMVRLNQAYATLSCPKRRAAYDLEQRRLYVHVQAKHGNTYIRQMASDTSHGPVILTTYDHRGRLHAFA